MAQSGTCSGVGAAGICFPPAGKMQTALASAGGLEISFSRGTDESLALPQRLSAPAPIRQLGRRCFCSGRLRRNSIPARSEEHTSELQSRQYLVCRLLLEKK